MTKKWLWVIIGVAVVLVAVTSCTDKKTDVAKELMAADKDGPSPLNKDITDVAKELIAADKDGPNPHFKDISDYKDRIERLEELTGSTPAEIGEATLKYNSQLTGETAMSCFQFITAVIVFTHSTAPAGKKYHEWEDYEEAANAFVAFVVTNTTPQ